jgi:class 3 adenylate cyclase
MVLEMDPKPPTSGQRMLAAIVFTDTVGFSHLVGKDEEGTLLLVKKDLDTMSKLCVQFEGRVVKSTGDGLMMLFSSAVQAVNCALEIQRIFNEQGRSDRNALTHRIGVHLGDVLVSEDDALGDGVNVAARLEQESEPGGICMSQTVYEVVKGRIFLQAAKIGDLKLKNIAEPIAAYKVAGVAKARRHRRDRKLSPALAAVIGLFLIAGAAGGTAFYLKKQSEDNPPPIIGDNLDSGFQKLGRDLGFEGQKMAEDALKSSTVQKEIADAEKNSLKAEPSATTPDTAAPQPPPIPKSDPADSTAEEKPAPQAIAPQVPTPTASPAFDEAWSLYAKKYDFKGMASWVRGHTDQIPSGLAASTLEQRYDGLATLVEWFNSALSKTTEATPVHIGFRGQPGTVWQRPNGRLMVTISSKTTNRVATNLGPFIFASIARGLVADSQVESSLKDSLTQKIDQYLSDVAEHRTLTDTADE